MKLTDKDGKEIKNNSLDLGVVEVNTTKEYEYFIENDTAAELTEIEVFIKHDEVKIVDYPKTIKSLDRWILKLKWSPTLKIKSGLKNVEIKIHGAEIYSWQQHFLRRKIMLKQH